MLKTLRMASLMVILACAAQTTMAKDIHLTFMGWGSTLEKQNVEKGIKAFERQNPGIKVDYMHVDYGIYMDKATTMFAAGKAPDVMFLNSEAYMDWARRNLLLDITPNLKSDRQLSRADYFLQPQENNRMYVDGKAYGIGSCWVAPIMFYSTLGFSSAGLAPPPAQAEKAWDWETFAVTARKLTAGPVGKRSAWGVNPGTGSWVRDFAWLASIGSIYNQQATEYTLDNTDMRSGLQRLIDLRAKYDCVGGDFGSMLKGKTGMVIDGSWALIDVAKQAKYNASLFDVAPLPALGPKASGYMQAHMHGISRHTKYRKEAWLLLKFLSSDEYQFDLVKAGLWLPSHTSLLTADSVAKWLTPQVHPKGFREVLGYIMNDVKSLFLPPGVAKAHAIYTTDMGPVWSGRKELAAVLPNTVKRMNDALALGRKRVTK